MNMEEVLRFCRFSKRYYGYPVFKECLQIALEDEDNLLYLTGIYMEVAERCQTSWSKVERNIRTMLEHSWKYGGKEKLEVLSGAVLYENPTVGEVLEILVCYLKEHSDMEQQR